MLVMEVTTEEAIIAVKPGSTTPFFLDFLDERKRKITEIIMDYVIVFSIAIMGVITNTLVILVYLRQGFKESVAVSMSTIAVWDLIKSIAGVMERCSSSLSVWDPAAAFSWANVSVVVLKYLICTSSYVTSVMAAYVAVERCLCVSIPLKVKWLLTPKVTLIACITISVVVFGAFSVMFGIYDVVWEWSATFNASILIYRPNEFYLANQEPLFKYYNLSGILWPLAAFVVIVIATFIITYKLRQGSKFRTRQGLATVSATTLSQQDGRKNQTTNTFTQEQQKPQDNLSKRDRQVVKMLLVIIIIYIVSLSPRISLYIGKYIVSEFYFLRRYHHMFTFVCFWLWVADFTNGSVNFFVFYAMSSSFRSTFLAMFSPSASSKPLSNSNATCTMHEGNV